MSDEEKYTVIGKAASEHAEVVKQIATLYARLKQIGDEYKRVGLQLNGHAEYVIPFGEPVDARLADQRVNVQLASWVDIAGVLDLTRQLREAISTEANLARQLTQLGIPPR